MLKQRVITAVVLLVTLLLITTQLPPFEFAVAVAGLLMLAATEWIGFVGLNEFKSRLFYLLTLVVLVVGAFFMLGISPSAESLPQDRVAIILLLGLLFWFLMFLLLGGYPGNQRTWNDKSKIATMGVLVLIPAWIGLVQLKYLLDSGLLVVGLVLLTSSVDIGAYFAGVYFGDTKLVPAISPKKSWEGVWGGALLCLLVSIGLIWSFNNTVLGLELVHILLLLLLSLLISIFSVIGDLFESMLKRNNNLKDSSNLLPGHGGLLDRIDSLLAVTPVFVLTLMLVLGGVL
ncbi:MAG: phosphatidate cytidylyltransferase [Gammaproteobacteria bacterium]|nr:phosphatidate cytidylyltransferase [Gammaproteobacteria bacterium]